MKKIGIVKSVNARPLTYGFENNESFQTFSDTPANLSKMLLNNTLDAALISSVECVRHNNLEYYPGVGVCTNNRVRSILYFKNKTEAIPDSIFVDNGSRSSVAMLKILFQLSYNQQLNTIEMNPDEIQNRILSGKGHHLLFGDNALFASFDNKVYDVIDLSEWWNKITGMSFCYAFWAYPKKAPVDPSIFDDSLHKGLMAIDEIILRHPGFDPEMLKEYFSKDLHYKTDENDLQGFKLFIKYCKEYKIC